MFSSVESAFSQEYSNWWLYCKEVSVLFTLKTMIIVTRGYSTEHLVLRAATGNAPHVAEHQPQSPYICTHKRDGSRSLSLQLLYNLHHYIANIKSCS